MASVAHTAQEIDDVLSKLDDTGASKYPGMTYEQGAAEALRWVLGKQDEPPATE